MENVLTDLEPSDIAALLSVFVCQEKTSVPKASIITRTSPALQSALQILVKITGQVLDVQRKNGVNPVSFNSQTTHDTPSSVSGSDELGGLQFALVEVVNSWAKGVSFKAIMEMTEALEGSIVRCMTRLDELCREVRDAARVIGNGTLYRKMEEASAALKRDIVFAASLYV
jgi:antiviral helicase SKI2